MSKQNKEDRQNEELFLFISNILDYIDDVFSNCFDRDIIHRATFLKTWLTHILNNQKIINWKISIENKILDDIRERFNKECTDNHAKYGLFEKEISKKETETIFKNIKEIVSSLITKLWTEEIPWKNENSNHIEYNLDHTIPGTDISFDERKQLVIVWDNAYPITNAPIMASERRKGWIYKILFCMAYTKTDKLTNNDYRLTNACGIYKEKFWWSKNKLTKYTSYISDINKTLSSAGSEYILKVVTKERERKLEPK